MYGAKGDALENYEVWSHEGVMLEEVAHEHYLQSKYLFSVLLRARVVVCACFCAAMHGDGMRTDGCTLTSMAGRLFGRGHHHP